MSKRQSIVGSMLVGILLAGTFVAAQGRVLASATGSGQVTINGNLRTFTFEVTRDAAGNARGQLQLNNRDLGLRLHATLNCLNVIGNTAIISGQVTDTQTAAWENAFIYAKVVDNGEGGNSPPDQLSLVYSVVPSLTCASNVSLPYLDVEHGNIQIRP